MKQFPLELEDALTPRGKRVLSGRDVVCGALQHSRFISIRDLIRPSFARAVPHLLRAKLWPLMTIMEQPIPPSTITSMKKDYSERLPKTVRVQTAMLESRRSRAWQRAQELGLVAFLHSQSFHAFAETLSGYRLRARRGIQVLCYAPGDYSGPHTDHHPEEPAARHGYVDLHLSFSSDGVAAQQLVYEREGHFSEAIDIVSRGGVTCYRLPFWHYTTPLMGTPGQSAHRWVLLGTFTDQLTPRR